MPCSHAKGVKFKRGRERGYNASYAKAAICWHTAVAAFHSEFRRKLYCAASAAAAEASAIAAANYTGGSTTHAAGSCTTLHTQSHSSMRSVQD